MSNDLVKCLSSTLVKKDLCCSQNSCSLPFAVNGIACVVSAANDSIHHVKMLTRKHLLQSFCHDAYNTPQEQNEFATPNANVL